MENAVNGKEPISGIVMHNPEDPNEQNGLLHLVLVYRVRLKESNDGIRFGWVKITFDDRQGGYHGGLWYAPIKTNPILRKGPGKEEDIGELAKMAAVAIPLSYATGKTDEPTLNKYCVLTNWWKERHKDGKYLFPGLEPSLYNRPDNDKLIRQQLSITPDAGEQWGANVI